MRHPWLLPPSMKRKHTDEPADRPAKRRIIALEQELSNLSLSLDNDIPMTPVDSANAPIVEEPLSPEITMKSSSWYEPEADRIVITDLAAYTEEELEEPVVDSVVNSALIERLKSQTLPLPSAQQQSQALVLFRPLQLPPPAPPADNDAMDVEP